MRQFADLSTIANDVSMIRFWGNLNRRNLPERDTRCPKAGGLTGKAETLLDQPPPNDPPKGTQERQYSKRKGQYGQRRTAGIAGGASRSNEPLGA